LFFKHFLLGIKSSTLISILVFGVLFALLSASQLLRSTAREIETRPALTQDDAAKIARADLEKNVAPAHVDTFVVLPTYFGHSLSLIFIHNNGTVFDIDTTDDSIYNSCTGDTCNLKDVNSLLRGHLFYIVDGSWQDSSARNCSEFIYAVDANSGTILWSYAGDVNDMGCQVQLTD
jgi:hypothetical protein